MYIVAFLHSNAETGNYLGFEGQKDIFEFVGNELSLINQDFNEIIGECIAPTYWEKVKDSAFRIEYSVMDGIAYPECIEQLNIVYTA